MSKLLIITFLLFSTCYSFAQVDDLESMLEAEMGEPTDYAMGTFLSTFVINSRSVEMLDKNGLNLRIAHRFGLLNSGKEHFFGLDRSNDVFLGCEYGVTDWLNLGIATTTYVGSINGMIKMQLLRQSKGARNFPFSVCLLAEADCFTGIKSVSLANDDLVGRMEYTSQVLLARKFGNVIGLQIMPTWLHRNLVDTKVDRNDIWTTGLGATVKIMKRLYLNAEYFYTQPHSNEFNDFYNPFSIGLCHQTSRHTFELFATNSSSIGANNYLGRTKFNFLEGDILIGINVSIILTVKR